MKKVGFSLNELRRVYGDFKALEIAKSIGADCVDFDLSARDYRKEGDKYSLSDTEIFEYFDSVRRHAEELGLFISQTHGRIIGYTRDEAENKAVLENARRDCIATAALKAPVSVFHSPTTGRTSGPSFPAEDMRELCFKMFSDILPFAEKYNIGIAIETLGDCDAYSCCDFFGQAEELYNIYQRIKNEAPYGNRVSICIDPGHSNKATRYGQPKPADVIRMFKGQISTLHLNDNDTLTDQHKPPKTGCIDWDDLMKALEEAEYSGVYNMEMKLGCFGKDLIQDTAAFSIKIMRDILK